MKSLTQINGAQQKAGGLAALYLAMAYLVAMPFYLLVVDYLSITDPVKKVAVLAANQGSISVMNLISYVVFGVVLAVLALALNDRLKDGMPATMQTWRPSAVGKRGSWIVLPSMKNSFLVSSMVEICS